MGSIGREKRNGDFSFVLQETAIGRLPFFWTRVYFFWQRIFRRAPEAQAL